MTRAALDHDGCALSYRIRGDGPPVVLIEGVGVHGDGWEPQVDAFAENYRCLTFDNRGMAASQPLVGPLSVERMADDVLALLDAQGWESAHVVGHSLGGLVAQHLALEARPRVRSLALLCTASKGSDLTRLSGPILKLGVVTYLGTRRMKRHAFLNLVLPPSLLRKHDRDELAAQLAPIFGHDLADTPPVVDHQLGALRAYDATSRLAELAGMSALVVSAEHDPIAPPRIGRALAERIPGARHVEIADAAHGVTVQRANQINALLLEHLGRSPGAVSVQDDKRAVARGTGMRSSVSPRPSTKFATGRVTFCGGGEVDAEVEDGEADLAISTPIPRRHPERAFDLAVTTIP